MFIKKYMPLALEELIVNLNMQQEFEPES